MTSFYTSEAALSARFRARGGRLRFAGGDARAALAWQRRARRALARHLGLHRLTSCPPRARLLETRRIGALTREKWLIAVEPGVRMPFYLFVPPLKPGERRPLVLCPHGHCSGGKAAVAGCDETPEIRVAIAEYHYDYGRRIAEAGALTACPDARGFGERREPLRQAADQILRSSCHNLMLAGAPLGLTVQGLWTWDLMRLLDVLQHDRRVDPRRVGCVGLSGGGLQTLNLAALDKRVKACVVSGYFYGFRESLLVLSDNCACNLVPHLWEDFDAGDIGALIAPRGLWIETGDADPLNGRGGLKNVRPQVAITRRVFAALGAARQVRHDVFAGAHRWEGTRSVPWLLARLQA